MIKKKVVNWTFKGKIVDDVAKMPEGSISFIYRITVEGGRYYIGRKTVVKPAYKSGKLKGQPKGHYPWKTYNGSSKELLELIKGGIPYSKEIIQYCYSKAETTYAETATILCSGALTDPLSFNYWIKAIIYSKHLKPNS